MISFTVCVSFFVGYNIPTSIITFEPPHDKTNKMTVRPAKTQISLGIRAHTILLVLLRGGSFYSPTARPINASKFKQFDAFTLHMPFRDNDGTLGLR